MSRGHAVHGPGRSPAVALAVLLPLLLAAACASEKQKELKPGDKAIILTAAVAPVEEATANAPIAARVSQVLVEPGQTVRARQVIVRLDPAPLAAAVSHAEASLALARANLAQARSGAAESELAEARAEVERLEQELAQQRRLAAMTPAGADLGRAEIVVTNAEARLERVYALFARGLVSRPELEQAQNEYAEAWQRHRAAAESAERRGASESDVKIAEARVRAARARLEGLAAASGRAARIDAARAQVRQAEADLVQARYRMAQATVEAPIDGIVTEVKARGGEKVEERGALVVIKDISRVQVKADLSPGLLPHVRVGQRAIVTVNTVPPVTETASVHRIQPVADATTQSLGMTFILPNPDLRFQPGFSARVEIPIGTSRVGPAR